jgi:hypothetical protein
MERMTPQDIVKTEIERTMPGMDWKVAYAQFHKMSEDPKHRIFRANNTLFIITNNGDHTADVSMCVADPLSVIPKSIKDFGQAMKKCGFTEIRFTSDRTALLRLIERAGYKPQVFPAAGLQGTNGRPLVKAKVVL